MRDSLSIWRIISRESASIWRTRAWKSCSIWTKCMRWFFHLKKSHKKISCFKKNASEIISCYLKHGRRKQKNGMGDKLLTQNKHLVTSCDVMWHQRKFAWACAIININHFLMLNARALRRILTSFIVVLISYRVFSSRKNTSRVMGKNKLFPAN